MSPMSERPKTSTLNGYNTPELGDTPELMLDVETAEAAVQADRKVGLDLDAEPMSFDAPLQPNSLPSKSDIKSMGDWWQRQSLKVKATIAAVLIGTAPVALTGTAAYLVANQSISDELAQDELSTAEDLRDKVNLFMGERTGDIRLMAVRSEFTDPKARGTLSAQEKGEVLEQIRKAYGDTYSSIAVFDLNGNVIAQTQGDPLDNHRNRVYFQDALNRNGSVVGYPSFSRSSGEYSLYTATPIMDKFSGKAVAVVRARIPVSALNTAIQNYAREGELAYYLVDKEGKVFLASKGALNDTAGKEIPSLQNIFPGLRPLQSGNKPTTAILENIQLKQEKFVAFIPPAQGETELNLGWSTVLSEPTSTAFASQRQLGLTLILGTLVAGMGVAALAIYLANRATRPVLDASEAVQKLGEGDLNTRLAVSGTDELATLGSNINLMAGQIQTLLVEQEKAAQEQLAAQAEVAAQQAKAAKEQQEAKEFLQNRALELLMEVGPLRQGDLTIRAQVTEDEIGTIADSYNATIGSLRRLVTQVQSAAGQVAQTADTSETSVQDLSEDALQQTKAIQAAIERITEMGNSIRLVADNAQSAEQVMQVASQTVQQGDAAMDKTVAGILAIRETVAETAKKVKQLGESSQKISKVVNLISSFADQTNLLALNASIEAARAGEEGRGFAVVADEVRSLARQSANATAEIEALVADIQSETNEVVQAMETGTQQVVTGTQLVEETRQSLNQITQASEQITGLVRSIAQAATQQSQASVVVSETMTDVAGIASNTSNRATQVLSAFQDLLNVAQDLQTTVGQFKLN
jgi:methyl-accepting chemotaxis protein PixJ